MSEAEKKQIARLEDLYHAVVSQQNEITSLRHTIEHYGEELTKQLLRLENILADLAYNK